jgi:hypothetical protein
MLPLQLPPLLSSALSLPHFADVTLYCALSMGMDAPAALAGSMLSMDIAPHFDKPFLSKSMAELWNARWNLVVGNALRFLFYDPINEGTPPVCPFLFFLYWWSQLAETDAQDDWGNAGQGRRPVQ